MPYPKFEEEAESLFLGVITLCATATWALVRFIVRFQ
jgi:hypothetical protein